MTTWLSAFALAAMGTAMGWQHPTTKVASGVLRPVSDALVSALVAAGAALLLSLSPLHAFALFWLSVAGLCDARCGLLPERWTWFGCSSLALLLLIGAPGQFAWHALWALGLSGALYGLRLLGVALGRGPGVGWGDVKIALGIGLAFGPASLLVAYGAFALTGLLALARSLVRRGATPTLPLGPGLAASALACLALAWSLGGTLPGAWWLP